MNGAGLALAAVLAVAPLACGGSPAGPSEVAKLGEVFTVENGGSSVIVDGYLGVSFEELLADSRCPVDVNCITGGDAAIRVNVRTSPDKSPVTQLTLHTGPDGNFPREVDIDSARRLTLIDLKPRPRGGIQVAPGEYKATLKVTAR